MDERRTDKITLENGLTLELYDCSRRVAGDRWLVSFVARIDVQVRPEYFEDHNLSFEAIRRAVGDKTTYAYEKTRNFIEETKKDEVCERLKRRFLQTTLTYFSSANFPRNMILSRYQEVQSNLKLRKRQ